MSKKGMYKTITQKKESKLFVGNCRPISLLSNISKLFEKVIHNRLYQFLESKCIVNVYILFKNQFGFRKKHSTNHAIIDNSPNRKH